MKRPFLLGLTGSIGMGKSTTAAMFTDEGVPVWDADDAVDRLYARDGAGARALAALQPGAVVGGAVDRGQLKSWIAEDPGALPAIEAATSLPSATAITRSPVIKNSRDKIKNTAQTLALSINIKPKKPASINILSASGSKIEPNLVI